MLTRLSTIKILQKSTANNSKRIFKTNYAILNTNRIIYYFQQDPESEIYDKYLHSLQNNLKTFRSANQNIQKVIVPRFQPSVQQIQHKLQTQWKNKKLVFNIDPSALIGSKRLFIRDHLEKNVYKGLTKPESLFSQINPSLEISTKQLKFDQEHFFFSDPLANQIGEQIQQQSQEKQHQIIQQALISAYQKDPLKFVNRLKSNLNVPQPYQKIIQLAMHNQNPIYFSGINQYAFRSLLSKALNLSDVKGLFMLSLKYAQAQSYRNKLNKKFPFRGKLIDWYQGYARQLIYLNNFKIIKKIQNGQIMRRLKFIMREKQDNFGEASRSKRRGSASSLKNKSNIVLFGHSYTLQHLEDYTIIQDLESPTLQIVNSTIPLDSLNTPASVKTVKKLPQNQSDAQKIQKHAILETMLGNLWNKPYTLNHFPYLSEDYNKLAQQDKQYVNKIYHDHLTRYTGAQRVWYQKNMSIIQKMDINSQQFKQMRFNYDTKKQEYEKNIQNLKQKQKQKQKMQIEKQMKDYQILNKNKLKKKIPKRKQEQPYSQYNQKYQEDQQQLKRLNIIKTVKKQQKVQQKAPQKQTIQDSKLTKVPENIIQAPASSKTGRRTRSRKIVTQTSAQKL